MAALLLLLRLSSALAAAPGRTAAGEASPGRYALIVDAGSTGSRLRMYNMSEGVAAMTPARKDEDKFETEPGISSYTDMPSQAGPSIQGLVQAAAEYIPREHHAGTMLWVRATAGMRMLPQEALARTFEAMDAHLSKPANCPFNFLGSGVLGGEEEALLAYLSINFILGTNRLPEDRVGILDMGGASMQIAHKPHGFILANQVSFYAGRKRQSIYAQSFSKFGLTTAVERAQRQVAEAVGGGSETVGFPCFNTGFEEVLDGVRFVGTGDSRACANLTRSLLHEEYECLMEPCPMMGVYMPPFSSKKRFYGISNFFYVPNGLGLIGWNEVKALKPAQISQAAEMLCNQAADEVKAENVAQWKYRKYHCFGGHYVYNALRAFGFGDDTTSITFTRKLRGQAADWSLGAALYEVRYMPLELQTRLEPCPELESGWEAATPWRWRWAA